MLPIGRNLAGKEQCVLIGLSSYILKHPLQKCVLDLKGVLMVGKHIYFSSDSVFCTYNAKKAADRMVLTLVGIKN